MANIVITQTTNTVKAVFNDLATSFGWTAVVEPKIHISIKLEISNEAVSIMTSCGTIWRINYTQVDSVGGSPVVSNADLFAKLEALLG